MYSYQVQFVLKVSTNCIGYNKVYRTGASKINKNDFFLYTLLVMKKQSEIIQTAPSLTYVLFGATGDLAVKKIFPALQALYRQNEFGTERGAEFRVIAVSRRDWKDVDFVQFLAKESPDISDKGFLNAISYLKIDIEQETGYDALASRLGAFGGQVIVHLSLAPQFHPKAVASLRDAGILRRIDPTTGKVLKILIEKPFGTNEKTARELDQLLLSCVDEKQIYRIDHYLGKETLGALMDLHEATKEFDRLMSRDSISSVRVALLEKESIGDRGASYDGVGAFRDVGQNHVLEILAIIAASFEKGYTWHSARTRVLELLEPPKKTCEFSRRGQYEGYTKEIGVKPDSQTETAFEIITSFTSGDLAGVPLALLSGKKMPKSEVFADVVFKEIEGLPKRMRFSIQPEQEIITEYCDGTKDVFVIPKKYDAYAHVILAAVHGRSREFVGAREIEALWRYADHIVACWQKVPLEIYSAEKPFII